MLEVADFLKAGPPIISEVVYSSYLCYDKILNSNGMYCHKKIKHTLTGNK